MIFFDPSLGQAGPEMLSYPPVHNTTSNPMKIAIPKEIKKQEYRVGLLPLVAYQLVQQGHNVLVERGAGEGTGYPDADYEQAGATLMDDHAALFAEGDLVVKVKEPLPEEYGLMRSDQVLFTYFHLAASQRTHRCRLPLRRHRAGLRDDRGQGPPAIARADERDRRAHVGAGRRLLFSPPLRRSRHSARRRAGRAAGPRDGARRRCGRC